MKVLARSGEAHQEYASEVLKFLACDTPGAAVIRKVEVRGAEELDTPPLCRTPFHPSPLHSLRMPCSFPTSLLDLVVWVWRSRM
jgi:hypothetical protein